MKPFRLFFFLVCISFPLAAQESNAPNLASAVNQYAEALKADMILIMDGPRHVSNEPTLSFGVRGISEITLTMYGPRADQHSGHYGNYAPNPAFRLAQLLEQSNGESFWERTDSKANEWRFFTNRSFY